MRTIPVVSPNVAIMSPLVGSRKAMTAALAPKNVFIDWVIGMWDGYILFRGGGVDPNALSKPVHPILLAVSRSWCPKGRR